LINDFLELQDGTHNSDCLFPNWLANFVLFFGLDNNVVENCSELFLILSLKCLQRQLVYRGQLLVGSMPQIL